MARNKNMNASVVSMLAENSHLVIRENPANGEVVSRETAHDLPACLRFVGRAAAAYPAWSARDVGERAAALERIAEQIENHQDDFCAAMIEEIGAPVSWANHNVSFATEILRAVAKTAQDISGPQVVRQESGFISRAERVPCGVCLGIAPWNAPLILGIRAIAAPMVCGNTVLLKGNEIAPRTYRLIGDVIQAAGVPEDVVQVFLCPAQDSERIVHALIENPVVRRVNFTGSTRVGRRIAELCAKHLKRPLLELGGQAPMVILDDADLDAAAQAAVGAAFQNQGQICMSAERLIVADKLTDAFIEKLEPLRAALILGDPAAKDTQIGPVVDVAAAERLSGLISDAVSKGARVVGGGGVRDAFVDPTILDGVEPEMRLYTEETFGPILSITRVQNDQEAVTVANDSDYGLSASVFSQDIARAESVAAQIHSGICHINRSTVDDDPNAPFGGVKASGYGRFGGKWAFDEFTELRWITSKHDP